MDLSISEQLQYSTVRIECEHANIAIERMAAFLNAFLLILDDTNTAQDPHALQQMIYMFGNGTGKMRGSLKGSRGTSS